jgi:hypothetical protein
MLQAESVKKPWFPFQIKQPILRWRTSGTPVFAGLIGFGWNSFMSTGPVDYFTSNHLRWLRYLTVSTIVVLGLILWIDDELRRPGAKLGMISLEIAGSGQAAKQIVMHVWNFHQRIIAAFEVGFDFLLIASYVPWLFLTCRWSAGRWQPHHESRARQLWLLAWLSFAVGLCDVVENIVLLDFIHSDGKSPAYPIAFWSAIVKFGCLAVVLAGSCWGVIARSKSSDSATEKKSSPPVNNPATKK